MKDRVPFTMFVVTMVFTGFFFFKTFWFHKGSPMFDFIPAYTAASMISNAELAPYIYELNPEDISKVHNRPFRNASLKTGYDFPPPPFVYPPLVAWMLQPVSLLSYGTAKRIKLIADGIFFLLGLWLIIREFSGRLPRLFVWLAALAALLFFHPLRYTVHLGSTTALIFSLLCCSLSLANRQFCIPAAILLGLCLCIKTSLTVIILIAAIFLRLRLLIATCATIIAVLVLGFFIAAGNLTLLFISTVLKLGSCGGVAAWNNQSCIGMLLRISHPVHQLFDWQCLAPPWWVYPINSALSAVLIVLSIIVAMKWRRHYRALAQNGSPRIGNELMRLSNIFIFNGGILLSLICMPLTWSHYMTFALIPLLWLLAEFTSGGNWFYVCLTFLAFVLLSINPVHAATYLANSDLSLFMRKLASIAVATDTLGVFLLCILLYRQAFFRLKQFSSHPDSLQQV